MKILFLDDSPDRHRQFFEDWDGHDITPVFTAAEAVTALKQHTFDLVFLDHDLGEFDTGGYCAVPAGNGLDVARFIAAMPEEKRQFRVVVHSWNPVGAKHMRDCFAAAGVDAVCQPFGTNMFFGK